MELNEYAYEMYQERELDREERSQEAINDKCDDIRELPEYRGLTEEELEEIAKEILEDES